MIELQKNWDTYTNTYDIVIKDKQNILTMSFSGAQDFHWIFSTESHWWIEHSMIQVTKEDPVLYALFQDLFRMMQKQTFQVSKTQYRQAYHDGMIEWHCDDDPYEEANVLKIRSFPDRFTIEFEFKSQTFGKGSGIRFRTSGSRYGDCYIPFQYMFNWFQNYEVDPNKSKTEITR